MSIRLLLLRLLALFALGVSTAQLADQVSGAGAFCSFGGSCEEVAASAYGRPLGVPLPVVGVAGFGLLFVLSLLPDRRASGLVRILALVAGLVGLGLLFVQFVILRKICSLCLLIDVAAIGLATLAAVRLPESVPLSRVQLLIWIVAPAVAVLIPLCWSVALLPDPVPEQVQAHWVVGRITIVEVTDFDCPFCRQADAVLKEALSRHDVRFVRLVAPMPFHETARPAAHAYLAAMRQGKGEEMATALFAADSRSPVRCRELAAKLGLNLAEYDKVVRDPATDVEASAAIPWARATGKGVPLIWVQDQLLTGVPTIEGLENAIRRAKPPLR